MTLRRILPLTAAVLLVTACNAGDATYASPDSESLGQKGLIMGGSGGYTAPSAPRMDGVNMGGSGGFVGGGEETTTTTNSSGTTTPTDSTAIVGRGVQMGGSGG